MMMPPAVIMIAIHVVTDHYIITIADNDLRGNRRSARKHCTNGRAYNDHSHISLSSVSPGIRERWRRIFVSKRILF
jgi:hypothetical protein